jgi:hypothetical protein
VKFWAFMLFLAFLGLKEQGCGVSVSRYRGGLGP